MRHRTNRNQFDPVSTAGESHEDAQDGAMADKKTYWEKLKDPRWQKKRLEILGAADFACELCGNKEETLNVHHGYYRKGADPWDYPTDSLHCLCETCHQDAQRELGEVHERIALLRPELVYDVVRLISEMEACWPFWYVIEDHERWKREHQKVIKDGKADNDS